MIKLKDRMTFRDVPDEGGGSDEPSKGMAAVADEPPAQEEPVKEEPVVAPPVVDASELAKQFGDVLAERFKPTDQEPKPLSPEEAKKLLNVFDITPEWIVKFDNLDTRAAALAELRDGVVKHSDTITQYRINETVSALEKKFSPALDFMKRYENEQTVARFNSRYEQLADPALSPMIEAVTEKLTKSGKKFSNETDLFDAIAQETEKAIKVVNKDFKLTAGSSPATTKPKGQSPNAIPVTTPGSSGGSGGKGGGEPAKSRALAIFE